MCVTITPISSMCPTIASVSPSPVPATRAHEEPMTSAETSANAPAASRKTRAGVASKPDGPVAVSSERRTGGIAIAGHPSEAAAPAAAMSASCARHVRCGQTSASSHREIAMPHRRTAPLAVLAAVAVCAIGASTAIAAPTWAPAATATIHPGVQVFTDGAQCTANFVFADATNVYLGQAAHCSGTGAATDTNGCTTQSLPVGTPIDITGADHPGTLVYNSWLTMQSLGETDADTCAFNDLALI